MDEIIVAARAAAAAIIGVEAVFTIVDVALAFTMTSILAREREQETAQ